MVLGGGCFLQARYPCKHSECRGWQGRGNLNPKPGRERAREGGRERERARERGERERREKDNRLRARIRSSSEREGGGSESTPGRGSHESQVMSPGWITLNEEASVLPEAASPPVPQGHKGQRTKVDTGTWR